MQRTAPEASSLFQSFHEELEHCHQTAGSLKKEPQPELIKK